MSFGWEKIRKHQKMKSAASKYFAIWSRGSKGRLAAGREPKSQQLHILTFANMRAFKVKMKRGMHVDG